MKEVIYSINSYFLKIWYIISMYKVTFYLPKYLSEFAKAVVIAKLVVQTTDADLDCILKK